MKSLARPSLSGAWLALILAFSSLLAAQDTTTTAAPAESKASQPSTGAPKVDAAEAAAGPTSAATPAAQRQPAASPAPQTAPEAPKTDAAAPAPAAPSEPAESEPSATKAAAGSEAAPAAAEQPPLREIGGASEEAEKERPRRRHHSGDEVPFGDHTIGEGSSVHEAVSIFGSTTVHGEVHGDAVSIMGDTTVGPEAEVHGAAVAIMGVLNVQGRVHHDAVNVMGGSTINNRVGGAAVAVLSDLELGPNAVIDGDLVVVGGTLTRDPGAVVKGNEVKITIPMVGGIGGFEGLSVWVKKCLVWGRLLAFDAQLLWAWGIAFAILGLYLLLALLFRGGVDTCVETFETRPGSTLVAALLTVLLTPVLTVLLVLTVVGTVVVPFLGIAMFCAKVFGKVVVLAWLGRRITRNFGNGPLGHTAVAVLVGGLIVLLLYCVPILGIILYKLFGVLGVGIVVYTLVLRAQREKIAAAPAAASGVAAASSTIPPAGVPPPAASSVISGSTLIGGLPNVPPPETAPPVTPPPPPVPAVPLTTLPRAGFWIRLGALAIDVILVCVVLGFVSGMLPWFIAFSFESVLPILATYGAVMWKLKGTTIGGIVCGLKIVRIDGREIDWATAIVRALGSFLSFVVVGLGFIWVVIDDEKQSWHDKIAGTTVVHVPRGVALV